MEENKTKRLEGKMNFAIDLEEKETTFLVTVHFEQSNENNLASFSAVKKIYDELFENQMKASDPKDKLSKSDMKELQLVRSYLSRHIEMLNEFIHSKYKEAVMTKDKPKIQVITTADILKNPNLKIIN